MRGANSKQEGMFSYVFPASLIPPNHPLRPIRAITPERLIRARLRQVLYSIRASRDVIDQIIHRIAHEGIEAVATSFFNGLLMRGEAHLYCLAHVVVQANVRLLDVRGTRGRYIEEHVAHPRELAASATGQRDCSHPQRPRGLERLDYVRGVPGGTEAQ
jgi:hypothetical protein